MAGDSPGDRLTEPQRKAARFLVYSRLTFEQVAEAAGVNWRTLHRWRATDDFKAHVAQLQAERDEQARRESAGLMADSVAAIRAGLDVTSRMLAEAQREAEEGGRPVSLRAFDVASLIGAAHAVFKTTAAQVGPVERHAVEATVRTLSDEVAAARLIAAGELAPDDED